MRSREGRFCKDEDTHVLPLWELRGQLGMSLQRRIYGQRPRGLPKCIFWGTRFLKQHHCYRKQYRKELWNHFGAFSNELGTNRIESPVSVASRDVQVECPICLVKFGGADREQQLNMHLDDEHFSTQLPTAMDLVLLHQPFLSQLYLRQPYPHQVTRSGV